MKKHFHPFDIILPWKACHEEEIEKEAEKENLSQNTDTL
jgi:hypothetical protein